jgi:hypothetical protein
MMRSLEVFDVYHLTFWPLFVHLESWVPDWLGNIGVDALVSHSFTFLHLLVREDLSDVYHSVELLLPRLGKLICRAAAAGKVGVEIATKAKWKTLS